MKEYVLLLRVPDGGILEEYYEILKFKSANIGCLLKLLATHFLWKFRETLKTLFAFFSFLKWCFSR